MSEIEPVELLDLSVVIPVFNEEGNVLPLHAALLKTLEEIDCTWEVIFIDDGSTDRSYEQIKSLCEGNDRCRIIRFRRNFGQTAALSAGLDHARGRVIISMDGDLQNDPSDLPLLLAKIEEGWDLVNGWRASRKDPWLSRRLPSTVANWLISLITGVHLHDHGCTLKAIRKEIAEELELYGEMHRFIPAMATQIGAKVIEIPVQHNPRSTGQSKYGISRVFRVLLDLMTVKFLSEYSTRPGHLFGLVGLAGLLVGGAVTAYLVIQRVLGYTQLADRPLLLISIFLVIIGFQFITMGLIGEMLSRVYHRSQKKSAYRIREIH